MVEVKIAHTTLTYFFLRPTNARKKPPEDPREEKKDAITAKKSVT
jgi:hypothetical protein